MSDNMKLWDKVFHTDPKHTKEVSFGRKFTSIDPMYQIMRATEVFGPVGQGWTYQAEYRFHETLVCCELIIQYKAEDGSNCTFGPVMGMEEWKTQKGKIDTDASKKALTDALTKALSHLGFNADVFLGMFDDQKYVARMRKEHDEKGNVDKQKEDQKWANGIIEQANTAKTTDELTALKNIVRGKTQSVGKGAIQAAVAAIQTAETKLAEPTKEENSNG